MKTIISATLIILVVVCIFVAYMAIPSPVQQYANATGNEIGKSAQELVDRCKRGEIDAEQANQILLILKPRLVNMAQRKMNRNSHLDIFGEELNLCWHLVLNGLLPSAETETVLRCLDTSWCQYKTKKPFSPPRFELHGNLTYPKHGIVLHHKVWIAEDNELQEQKMAIEGYICINDSGIASMTWGFEQSLSFDINPQQSLSAEKETVVYHVPVEVVKELPSRTLNEDHLALCRRATSHENAVKLCSYQESTVLHEANRWKSSFSSDLSKTKL